MQHLTHFAHLTFGELGLASLLFLAGLLTGVLVVAARLRDPR